MTIDPRDLGRVALGSTVHMPRMQDGVQFDVDGIRHTVNSASDPRFAGLSYHSQMDLASGAHQTNIIRPDGSVIR